MDGDDASGCGATELPHPTARFVQTIRSIHGAAGAAWLQALPQLLRAVEGSWALELLEPFPDLGHHYVAPAWREDGSEVVLKVGPPDPRLAREAAALALIAGRGAVRLLEADLPRGVLILERLRPGTGLAAVDDDARATEVAVGLMRRLHRPVTGAAPPFRTMADRAADLNQLRERFDGGTGPLPESLVERAEGLFADLLASAGAAVLLHGDLHHGNILRAEREPWLAIDPQGVVGEPAAEVGPFLCNPMPDLLGWPRLGDVLARRVGLLAAGLGVDEDRVLGWAIAHAVLSAWWEVEDGLDGWDHWLAAAEVLAGLWG
jgi:streptomycin 6-kinase